MEELKGKTDSKNTLQRILAEQKAKQTTTDRINKVLLEWESNDRPDYRTSMVNKSTYITIVIAIGLYFWWIGQPIITIVTSALFFLWFVLISVPPIRVKHKIEKLGVRSGETLYLWEDLTGFWFVERGDIMILYVDTRLNIPARLMMIVDSFKEGVQIANLLIQKLDYRINRERQGFWERLFDGEIIEADVFFPTDESIPRNTETKEVSAEETKSK